MAQAVPKHTFFVSHAAFGYIAGHYGLTQVPVAGLNSQSDPSQKELTEIVDLAKKENIKYIFFEQNVSSNLTKIIQKEIGAKTLTLHNLSVLTKEDIENNEDYFTLMHKNIDALKQALSNYENIERLQKADQQARDSYAYKGSHAYVKQLLAYITSVKKQGMPFYNLKMGEEMFVSARKLSQMFYEKFGGLDIDFRLKKIRTELNNQLEARKAKELKKRLKELRAVNQYIGSDHELEQQANNELNKRYGKLTNNIEQLGFVNLHKMYVQSLTFGTDNLFLLFLSGQSNHPLLAIYISILLSKPLHPHV